MSIILYIVIPFLISATVVSYLLPKILLLSLNKRLVDPTDDRKVHTSVASRLGGVVFLPALAMSILLSISIALALDVIRLRGLIAPYFMLISASVLIIYIVGVADDMVGVRYRRKFIFQSLGALLIICSGTYIQTFNGLLGIDEVSIYIGAPFTFVLIIFIINAINLIDGIDGLASMLSIMALMVYGLLFFYSDSYGDAIVSFATIGVLTPFCRANIFGMRRRSQAKIFMGDSGSLVIGTILGVLAIDLWNTSLINEVEIQGVSLYVMAAYSMLVVPCFDVMRVVISRIKRGVSPFEPDKSHIHHEIMAMGYSQYKTLTIIVFLNIMIYVLNLIIMHFLDLNFVIVINVLVWYLIHRVITRHHSKGK